MGHKPESRIDGIFYDLIVRHGWGMYGDSSALYADPPEDVESFVDELLVINGSDPRVADKKDRRFLRGIVEDWMFDPAGRGAKSGLPRKP